MKIQITEKMAQANAIVSHSAGCATGRTAVPGYRPYNLTSSHGMLGQDPAGCIRS